MKRIVEALGSLRLAVVLMLAIASVCTVATFYESTHGTAAAQRDFYRTARFTLLLALLGVNIFCSMLKRYPWAKHHAGFVTAHVGILVLLAGSLVSLHWGLDSNMALYEGEATDRVTLLEKALQVSLPGQSAHGSFGVELDEHPPGPGRERRFRVPGSDVTLVAEAYEEQREPAVKVRLEGPAGRGPSEWVLWTETRGLPFAGGTAYVAYRSPELALPFRVALLRFNSDKYPGSSMAATYESWVRIEDPEQGVSEHHISMNNPLHYRGYIFFQASFVEGRPMMSIFSVTRAPGLPLVYLGVALIAAGLAWMFYLKPALAKRQAVKALVARVTLAAPADGRA